MSLDNNAVAKAAHLVYLDKHPHDEMDLWSLQAAENLTATQPSPPCILSNVTRSITQPNASKQKDFPSVYRGILGVLTTGIGVR